MNIECASVCILCTKWINESEKHGLLIINVFAIHNTHASHLIISISFVGDSYTKVYEYK